MVSDRDSIGHPFLEFLNTVEDDGKTRCVNSFSSGAELLGTLRDAGFGLRPSETSLSDAQLASTLALRETAHAVLSALANKRKPGREEALALETAIKSALADSSIGFEREKGAVFEPGPLGGLHDMLALSALDLLQRGDLDRLKECKRCTRLFLDHGRGPGRRWCAMSRCGNRAKAENFRARQRDNTTP